MIPPLLALSQNRSKLKLYIAHLTDLCHDRDPSILSQLTPPSHYHDSEPPAWEEELQKMTLEQVQYIAFPPSLELHTICNTPPFCDALTPSQMNGMH